YDAARSHCRAAVRCNAVVRRLSKPPGNPRPHCPHRRCVDTSQEVGRALLAAVHATAMFGAYRLPALATGLVIRLLRSGALQALEEPVLAEPWLGQQHVLEHLDGQRLPV